MKHFLWAAWRGDIDARDWLVGWADGWRGPTIREIDGKLAGFAPLTLWYPDSSITPPVEGKTWYDKRMNHWARPDMTHDTFLAAYWLTEDPKFLVPFNMTMKLASQAPLQRGNFERGSREWQLASLAHFPNNMGTEQSKVALYRWLTGDKTYDEYTIRSATAAIRFRMNSDLDAYLKAFESAARATRYNLEMKTSEVMAMDRAGVPASMTIFSAYTGAISSMRDMATPTFAVTYDTPTTDFAALVIHSSKQRLRLWLYNFGSDTMPIGLKLWRLDPGKYVLLHGEQVPGEFEYLHRYVWQGPQDVECIHRGAGPTINVPPGKPWAVDLRLKAPVEIPDASPDLAVMPRDVEIEGDALSVTVHNVGSGDAGPFHVMVETTGTDGIRQLARQRVDGLAASRNLLPSTQVVSVKLPSGKLDANTQIHLELVDDGYEACVANNVCMLQAGR
jgi:hypothetical protein